MYHKNTGYPSQKAEVWKEKVKTNLEWYMQLPDPYRMKAINNAERDDVLGFKISSLPAALFAFPWETTPEGYDY